MAQRRGSQSLPCLDPEVLSVFAPPFVSREDGPLAGAGCGTLSKAKRRSFRKKREKAKAEPSKGLLEGPRGPDADDISVPNGVDLLALPQLCFPGAPSPGVACRGGGGGCESARWAQCAGASWLPLGPLRPTPAPSSPALGGFEAKRRLGLFGRVPISEDGGGGVAGLHGVFMEPAQGRQL